MTALMCCWLYFHLRVSHLSCGSDDVRSRTRRKVQREHLQLSINEESTCHEIRDIVLLLKVSKSWSTEQVRKHVQDNPSYPGGSAGGPTPTEVDTVEKAKEKKTSEQRKRISRGRGRGRGRQNKGKGKGRTKGKSKGKKGGKGNANGKKGNRVAFC